MKNHDLISLEILEDRIGPAGIVDVAYDAATGELTLTGNGNANTVNVFQTGPNTHRTGGGATHIETAATAFLDYR